MDPREHLLAQIQRFAGIKADQWVKECVQTLAYENRGLPRVYSCREKLERQRSREKAKHSAHNSG